uniref:FAD-binding PCMH-type domain-containing protein n=1 Tax=Macrostomum lignano TaxID=282301 RepID=A0A1I8GBT9_9PLAT
MYRQTTGSMEIQAPSDPYLFVNDVRYEIPRDCSPEMTLNDFLREVLEIKGTKVMCKEAGCGCCIVCAVYKHPSSGEAVSKPVNSCITPLYSTVGWHVITVEGIGSAKAGYHPIQSRLADGYGSQCGYCSPGFVMSAYSQLRDNPRPTELEVEHFFDGNICRCTGYRPILDAMKTLACDSERSQCLDMEDLSRGCCSASALEKIPTSGLAPIARGWRGQRFYNPGSLADLFALLGRLRSQPHRLVFGNTSAGVFKEDAASAEHLLNIRNVPELYGIRDSEDGGLIIGSSVSLHELIVAFNDAGRRRPGFGHLGSVAEHLQRVANQAVRRNACWAGNLMMKHAHPEFPSDVYVLLEASRATVRISDGVSEQQLVLADLLRQDMRGRVILSATLPKINDDGHHFRSFKVTPRRLNAHAYLNAAFSLSVDKKDGYRVTERPSLVFGGVSGKFNHAVKTENYLQNRSLLDEETVSGAMQTLEAEANPAEEACGTSPEHRRGLAANLLYKCLLSACADALPRSEASGADTLERRAQSGQQDYEEELQPAPIGRAMPKLEARAQAAGEAKYVNDAPAARSELFAAFVQAPEAPAALRDIKADEAEQVPGYHSIITAKDLEGKYENNVPVAIVLASSQWAADQAARLVVVDYEQTGDPITSVAEAVAKNSVIMQAPDDNVGEDFDQAYDGQACQVEGQLVINEQAHFSIETLTASVAPTEEGLVVTAPHQWVDALAMTLSRILGRPANQIRVVSPRIGGGFGGKLLMIDLVAAACAVASDSLGRPVRMYMSLGPTLALAMKRPGMLLRYRAAAGPDEKLRATSWDISSEAGYTLNMQAMLADELKHSIDSAFFCPSYRLSLKQMRTDKPESTFVRGPGPAPACLANLLLMDHLAFQLGVDPIEFKYRNLYSDGQIDIVGNTRRGDNFQRMWRELHQAAEVEKRLAEIAEFNKNNRFRKRGLDMSASSYNIFYDRGRPSQVYLALQASDGSVTLSHGGAEMGQGIGVKAAQAAAAILEIDINLVKIKATDSHVLPNNEVTGGSSTSEWNCQAAVDAATQIKERLRPIREANPDASWKDLLNKASQAGVSLAAMGSYYCKNGDRKGSRYSSTGVGVTEAEVDILTGEFEIRRADLMMDVGKSLNPGVDIGQIEGAFVPQAADIPRDLRVHVLRNSPNEAGVLSTKAIGEPPICLAATCVTAVKRAIEAFREQTGKPKQFLAFDPPLTPEKVLQLSGVSAADRVIRQK